MRCGEAAGRLGQPSCTSSPRCPRFSVVTVSLNNARGIRETIASVLRQTYPHVEYIVIDGGSTDGTLEVLRHHDQSMAYWVSEPDGGISDAFNKGISLCTGEWIGLLNAGDWYEDDAVERMAAATPSGADFLFAACTYHPVTGRTVVRWPDPHYGWKLPLFMPQIHHPTVFVKRDVYAALGGFDVALRYAMDYDFLLRIHRAGRRGYAVSAPTVHMPEDGASARNYPGVREEVEAVSVRQGLPRVVARLIKFALMRLYAVRQGLQHR